MTATVTKLTCLPAEVLRLHLSSRHFITSKKSYFGLQDLHSVNPATMAQASIGSHNTTALPSTSTLSNSFLGTQVE